MYKRQPLKGDILSHVELATVEVEIAHGFDDRLENRCPIGCLLYTSDAADERSSVDLGGRRIIKKKKINTDRVGPSTHTKVIAR